MSTNQLETISQEVQFSLNNKMDKQTLAVLCFFVAGSSDMVANVRLINKDRLERQAVAANIGSTR